MEVSLRLQFRTVSSLDGDQLDAVIVPVFKEGDASDSTPADFDRARRMGRPGKRRPEALLADYPPDAQRRRRVAADRGRRRPARRFRRPACMAGGQRRRQGTVAVDRATRSRSCLETDTLDNDTRRSRARSRACIYAMWRPEAYRTGEEERQLPPLEEVLLLVTGDDGGDYGARSPRRGRRRRRQLGTLRCPTSRPTS